MNKQVWIDPRCDREGWPAGPWDSEPDKVQWTDGATGFVCLAKRHPLSGHWCGYVGVEPGHPWHGKEWDDVSAEVHCGLTYGNKCQEGPPETTICHLPEAGKPEHLWWLGFDCAQSGDYSPLDALMGRDRGYPYNSQNETYKNLGFVKNECASLALQASVAQPAASNEEAQR